MPEIREKIQDTMSCKEECANVMVMVDETQDNLFKLLEDLMTGNIFIVFLISSKYSLDWPSTEGLFHTLMIG